MNNFQLNNTSVYLGGQCKWDIILSHQDDELVITGFQLTPISSNVPFNKKGEVTRLNDEHSYTLKKFCSEIKEGLWSVNPCLTEHTRSSGTENQENEGFHKYDITGYYDQSFVCGLKRSASYQVYNKQYEFFQPIWLEKLSSNQHLKFKFNIYSASRSGKRSILDSKTLDLKLSSLENSKFHNQFVTYFYDWLKYLNIVGEGNNRVLCVDLQGGTVQIDGVSTISGQRSGKISCDYIADNLLSYERPNIETDYILSSLFKNHNAITSQLFNLNFCVDVSDILDPFLLRQLKGGRIAVDCNIYVVDDESNESYMIERRSIFTNYQFIQKDTYNPFLFMHDMHIKRLGVSGQPTGEISKNYNEVYIDQDDHKIENFNVLNYLRDNKVESIKDKNKLIQPIIHWGYPTYTRDTFNLYGGYAPYIVTDKLSRYIDQETQKTTYFVDTITENRINGVSVPTADTEYTGKNGALDWFFPKNILYYEQTLEGSPSGVCDKIQETFLDIYMLASSELQKSCKWTLRDSLLKETMSSDELDNSITMIYIGGFSEDNIDSVLINRIENGNNSLWKLVSAGKSQGDSASHFPLVFSWDPNGRTTDYSDYLIISNDLKGLTLKTICGMNSDNTAVKVESEWNRFNVFKDTLNKHASDYNQLYDFYGFKQEIEVGKDDLNNDCYYKSLSKNTFLYRKCKKLSPYIIEDGNYDINYEYRKDVKNNNIIRMNYDDDLLYTFENCVLGRGKILVLMSKLSFTLEKNTSDEKSLTTLIKEYLAKVYGYSITNNSVLIDYVYNLYDVNFVYDYKSIDGLDDIIYNIKMILK